MGGDFELASLHVSESHRGRGIGSKIVRRLLDDFEASQGSSQVTLYPATKILPCIQEKDASVIISHSGSVVSKRTSCI